MKYTPHFSKILKLNGPPHLSSDMFALYMNIVHLEGRIAMLGDLVANAKENDQKFVYRLKIDQLKDKVTKLANRMEPEQLLAYMVENSVP
jgi:hypothetical protein